MRFVFVLVAGAVLSCLRLPSLFGSCSTRASLVVLSCEHDFSFRVISKLFAR